MDCLKVGRTCEAAVIYRILTFIVLISIFLSFNSIYAVDNKTCLDCHSDKELTTVRGNKEILLYVDSKILANSVHSGQQCVDCHPDADVEDFPHKESLAPVYCGNCHDDEQLEFDQGIHGQALKRKQIYAPTCSECHGKHDILSPKDTKSPSTRMKIPFLCGTCHREGGPVARVYNISEHNIIENYSLSIHGEGLFKKGLIVTATCIDCHNSHMIQPHTNAKASTSPRNIAATCMKCHSRIEDVHIKVIEGKKWTEAPGTIPACTDCHVPHKARKASIVLNVSDRACLKCHEKTGVHKVAAGKKISLHIKKEDLEQSVHKELTCVKCHSDVNPKLERPCETAKKVDCSGCHIKIAEEYFISGHGQGFKKGDTQVPQCITCHDYHDTKSHLDETAKTFRSSIPRLCGECHRKDTSAEETKTLAETNALYDYSRSVHGKKLTEKGLLPSAVCTDCHTTHMELNHKDYRSSVHPKNIPATCASCHRGIYKDFTRSIHFSVDEKKAEKLPTCTNCHSSHKITEVGRNQFLFEVTNQCGVCHKKLAETYLDTMHGKAHKLGYAKSAKCSDCHTAHLILPVSNPASSLGLNHIVNTCKKCHEDANQRFTGYLTHATHHDPVKYPILFYTYWAMTGLLVTVFVFFGLHTLLWLPRSFKQMKQRKKIEKAHKSRYYIRRFELTHRVTHLFVIVSFMSLALTGMMLKFSGMPWAGYIARLIGGVEVAGTIHRLAALVTFGYFFSHLFFLIKKKRASKTRWKSFIFGPESLMFNKKDLSDFRATLKWFFGKGPRPDYGRWTYWEKFDYFAVFWGVAIIGTSGLMLWFPEFFTKFLPGWLINVATIIHSDEALLAVGFIFTIHFFNTHLRPEAFPMDKVIFTGLVPLEEYKQDRPHEYEAMKTSGNLKKVVQKDNIPEKWEKVVYIIGFTFLSFGIILILLIIYSVLFGYQ
jgi:predicted CXXCH cytochrome family protein